MLTCTCRDTCRNTHYTHQRNVRQKCAPPLPTAVTQITTRTKPPSVCFAPRKLLTALSMYKYMFYTFSFCTHMHTHRYTLTCMQFSMHCTALVLGERLSQQKAQCARASKSKVALRYFLGWVKWVCVLFFSCCYFRVGIYMRGKFYAIWGVLLEMCVYICLFYMFSLQMLDKLNVQFDKAPTIFDCKSSTEN